MRQSTLSMECFHFSAADVMLVDLLSSVATIAAVVSLCATVERLVLMFVLHRLSKWWTCGTESVYWIIYWIRRLSM